MCELRCSWIRTGSSPPVLRRSAQWVHSAGSLGRTGAFAPINRWDSPPGRRWKLLGIDRLRVSVQPANHYPLEIALFISLAVLAGALGVWLLYRGIRYSPSAGQPRCRRCWYPLGMSPEEQPAAMPEGLSLPATCPECGCKHASLAQTLRTRRSRWRIALAVPMLLIAAALPYGPRIRQQGFWPSLPEWVVYSSAVLAGPDSGPWLELQKRVLLSQERSRPVMNASTRLIAARYIITREHWPAGIAPRVHTNGIPLWRSLPKHFGRAVERGSLIFDDVPAPSRLALPSHEQYWREPTWPVAPPRGIVGFADQFESILTGSFSGRGGQLRQTLTWTLGGTADDLLAPISGPAIDHQLLAYLRPQLIRGMTTNVPAISIIRGTPRPAALRDLALGLRLTITFGDQPVATAWCWHAGSDARPNGNADLPPLLLEAVPDQSKLWDEFLAFSPSNPPGPQWRLIITADPLLALRDLEATSYWKGTMSVPLENALAVPAVPAVPPSPGR